MASPSIFCFSVFLILALAATSSSQLSPYYYDYLCPEALPIIQRVVETAIHKERRMGSSLLRLHFHDCFVNGCDGSILLDSTSDIDSEKNALPNANSARGFEVVDQIKSEVDKACGGPVVSCADILAVAARDSVVALGGPTWVVPLGRRDSTTASKDAANNDIPSPFMDLPALISNFKKQGLNAKDLVALSGAHTIGFAQCLFFKNRIHNDTNIDPNFAAHLRTTVCPLTADNTLTGTNKNLSPLDSITPEFFDASYFNGLVNKRGLLHSDQALSGRNGYTDGLVRAYSSNAGLFWADFAYSMIKMGNIKVLTGNQGEVRFNCRKVN